MEQIIIFLLGIFIGVAVAGYIFTEELNKKDRKILNQKEMIRNRDNLIDYQCNRLRKIKAILNSDEIFVYKYDKIKELFQTTNQENSSK